MNHAIILDCEFLSAEGAPRRFWNGPFDPDPTVVQIGAWRMAPDGDFAVTASFTHLIRPVDRHGQPITLDPVFAGLTGLTDARLADEGVDLVAALDAFTRFANGAMIWSWGKDELHLMAISAWIAGIPAPLPAQRFGNACTLLLKAGVSYDVVQSLRSHTLCAHFGLTLPAGTAHDATHDAQGLGLVLRHLLQTGQLDPADLRTTAP
jgi:DNA polymerase III epsilon subunit-like protein